MEHHIEEGDHATTIHISGSIDALTSDQVEAFVQEKLGNQKQLVLDLAGVDFVSSAGLRVLMTVLKQLRRQKGDLRLAAPQPNVLRMLNMAGFTSIAKLFDTVEDAQRSFAAG